MQIIEIRDPNNKEAIKLFHQVAIRVYQDDPVWVPKSEMLFTQRFQHAQTVKKSRIVPVIALKNNQPVARAVAILPLEAGCSDGSICFVDWVKEYPDAGHSVLERCERILQKQDVKSILLPKLDNLLVGLLTKGFELPHTVFTNHNAPYYLEYLMYWGYEINTKIYALHFSRETVGQIHVELPGFTTREFDRRNLSDEIVVFHKLQQAIFGNHPGYIPRTLEEDRQMVNSFLPFLQDDLVIIAENDKGVPVGLLVCLPDIYQAFMGQKINRVRIVSIGTIPGLTHKGIGALMGAHLTRNITRKKDYVSAEASLILKNNVPPQNLAKRFHSTPGKEFVLLEKLM